MPVFIPLASARVAQLLVPRADIAGISIGSALAGWIMERSKKLHVRELVCWPNGYASGISWLVTFIFICTAVLLDVVFAE